VGLLLERLRASAALARPEAAPLVARVDYLLREGNSAAVAEVERLLWPTKLLGRGLPTYLVPIKPGWAEHIVDERLAHAGLFGARDDLALNREAVYYRSPQQPAPSAPGRVLWYVSADQATIEGKAIRACSAIDEVAVVDGRDAYRRNRRFGVYAWRDIQELRDASPDGSLMTIRFSSTELLDTPVTLDRLRSIMAGYGKGIMTAGPMPITDAEFAQIYRAGGLG
jgi:hypothetical protein